MLPNCLVTFNKLSVVKLTSQNIINITELFFQCRDDTGLAGISALPRPFPEGHRAPPPSARSRHIDYKYYRNVDNIAK